MRDWLKPSAASREGAGCGRKADGPGMWLGSAAASTALAPGRAPLPAALLSVIAPS